MNLMSTAAWPNEFWSNLIKLFDVGSYAWTIILFTIVLKLVLLPMDFLQRYFTNKTTRAQMKLQPQILKLQKQYGQNQTLLYQKQNELYQKNGFSMKGSCTVMLVYLVLTLTIFISLFSSMQGISNFKIKNQYHELEATYDATYTLTSSEEEARQAVADKYVEIKDNWLWIKNIWRADKATEKAILDYNSYISATKDDTVTKEKYDEVMTNLYTDNSLNSANGYYVLSVIVVLVSFLSQWVTRKMSQPKNANNQQMQTTAGASNKLMMFLMPILMLVFTLSSSAIFSIYIIINSLISTLFTPVITIISNKIEDNIERKKELETKVDYRR